MPSIINTHSLGDGYTISTRAVNRDRLIEQLFSPITS